MSSYDIEKLEEGVINPTIAMNELENDLSKIVGLEELKKQLHVWVKGSIMDERRRQLAIKVGKRKPPHMTFLGNPGTGKNSMARIIGKLFYNLRVLPSSKVVRVQKTDLVGESTASTGIKTREMIKAAEGGILFVDEAYRLIVSGNPNDFGKEALDEIMHAMDNGKLSIIFAGYQVEMQHLTSSNDGLRRRVISFVFPDFTCKELAGILHLRISENNFSDTKGESSNYNHDKGSFLDGFKLDWNSCNIDVVSTLIETEISKEQREKMNGGLVDQLLTKARENLDIRLEVDCDDKNKLITLTFEDLKASILLLKKHHPANHGFQDHLAEEFKRNCGESQYRRCFEKSNHGAEDDGHVPKCVPSQEKSDDVERCIISDREMLKETDAYKKAMEKEWASRRRELQIQAKEASKLRRMRKRENAKHMRFLDLERRQNQRVEEIREKKKEDEEEMNMKELIRAEVRNELSELETTSSSMASLLKGLGIQVCSELADQVRAACKRALISFHPDRAAKSNIRQQVEAEEKFKLIIRMKEKFSLA